MDVFILKALEIENGNDFVLGVYSTESLAKAAFLDYTNIMNNEFYEDSDSKYEDDYTCLISKQKLDDFNWELE